MDYIYFINYPFNKQCHIILTQNKDRKENKEKQGNDMIKTEASNAGL